MIVPWPVTPSASIVNPAGGCHTGLYVLYCAGRVKSTWSGNCTSLSSRAAPVPSMSLLTLKVP